MKKIAMLALLVATVSTSACVDHDETFSALTGEDKGDQSTQVMIRILEPFQTVQAPGIAREVDVSSICIQGHVFALATYSRGVGLEQIMITNDQGRIVPMICPDPSPQPRQRSREGKS